MKNLKKLLACALALLTACSVAAVFASNADAAQNVNGLFVSEICFNPNYETENSKVIDSNDYFEFVEIKNVGSSAIDLSDAALYYCKEGTSGSSWYKNAFVFENGNSKSITPGEIWVIGVYTIDTPSLGLGYSSSGELRSYWNAFNAYYGTSIGEKNRVLAVAAQSKQSSWLSNATSLPNSGSNGALRIATPSQTLATVSYSPSVYSQDGYALQTEYISSKLNIIGIAGPTPGRINYNQLPNSDSRPAATGTPVSIASLNVCYSINGTSPANGSSSDYSVAKREKRVLEWLGKAVADIICLSEIDAAWWKDINSTILSPGYELSGNTSCYGLTDGAAHERKTDSYNPVFYSTKIYTKLEEGHFWLLDESPSIGNKICNWVLLKNNSDGTLFCLFNTHLSANDSSTVFNNRYKETVRLGSMVKSTVSSLQRKYRSQAASIPYVISGDFNINEGSPLYRKLLDVTSTSDAKYLSRNTSTATTFNDWGNLTTLNGRTIDFVLVSDGVDCQTYNIRTVNGSDGYLASDHAAVRLNLTVKNSEGGGFDPGGFDFDFSSILSWFKFFANIVRILINVFRQFVSALG
ncbi:MAG: hypothetical protein IJM10_08510 [Clostridia bacterium]|nr:hypothetical protein [Clostridia bacterium]